MIPIRPLDGPSALPAPAAPKAAKGGEGASFADTLKESMNRVNELQNESDAAIKALAKGESASLHETLLAVEKADLSFKLMMQVRNKLLDAYKEVMRTPM